MRKDEKAFQTGFQRRTSRVCRAHFRSGRPLNLVRTNGSLTGFLFLFLLLLLNSKVALSQERLEPVRVDTVAGAAVTPQAESVSAATSQAIRSAYILGPGDMLTVQVVDTEDFNNTKLIRVDGDGKINLPLIGHVLVSGLTLAQLESEIASKLKTYVHDPQVIVQVTTFRSQPVSVLGYVNRPGIQEIQGPRTLMEVISMAGGLQTTAGGRIKITRPVEMGKIPLPSVALDPTEKFYVAEVDIKAIMETQNLTENILILPHDVITVPKAPIVYVVGAVRRPGGFVLGDKENITVLRAITLAEGWDRFSSPSKARILRFSSGKERVEVDMNLKDLLNGKAADVPMLPDDILYVPGSESKRIWAKIGQTALSTTAGVAIYSTR